MEAEAQPGELGVPGQWAALSALAAALLLSMATWFSATAVIPQLRVEWHLGSAAQAWLTIAVQLGFVIGALVSALLNLADIVPVRRLMLIGALGAAAANALLIPAGGPAFAIPLRALTGAFLAIVYPPALKAISTWFRRGRGTALGVLVGALTIGSASPHLLNAVGGIDWRTVIWATSLITVAGGLLFVLAYRDGPYVFPKAVFDPRQAARAFSNRGLRLAAAGYFGHMWELYAMWAWFAVFFADVLLVHTPRAQNARSAAALAAFFVIGAGAIGCLVGGVLGDRWGRTRTTALSLLISGTCAGVIGFLRPGPIAFVLVIGLIWGVWVVADSAQFSTMVTELADQTYVGTAVTLQLALGFTLTVVTIWLIPIVRDAVTWRIAFALLVPGPLLGLFAMLRLVRLPEARLIGQGRG